MYAEIFEISTAQTKLGVVKLKKFKKLKIEHLRRFCAVVQKIMLKIIG
jgi:hypothetical protein